MPKKKPAKPSKSKRCVNKSSITDGSANPYARNKEDSYKPTRNKK